MTITVSQSGNRKSAPTPFHPDWQAWIDASAYSHAEAMRELGLSNGTFYRRMKNAPTRVDRLAMSALYEGIGEFEVAR